MFLTLRRERIESGEEATVEGKGQRFRKEENERSKFYITPTLLQMKTFFETLNKSRNTSEIMFRMYIKENQTEALLIV